MNARYGMGPGCICMELDHTVITLVCTGMYSVALRRVGLCAVFDRIVQGLRLSCPALSSTLLPVLRVL